MNVTVGLYLKRVGRGLDATTLGLGPWSESAHGPTQLKVEKAIAARLKDRIRDLDGSALVAFQSPSSVRLERPSLDLSLRGDGGKRKITGTFPVVLTTRQTSATSHLVLCYSPCRPDEWFPLDLDLPLAPQASRFFSRVWAGVSTEEVEALKTTGKDRIGTMTFEAHPRTLLDQLPEKARGPWDHLSLDALFREGKKRKRPGLKVLPHVGVDETVRAAEGTLPTGMARSRYAGEMQLFLGGERRLPVIVVGPPGSGKTTIVAQWIQALLALDGFAVHRNLDAVHHVWSMSGRRLIAGMSHVGDWEQRVLDLCLDARRHKVVLFAEDIAAFGRIGRTRDSDRCLADALKGPVSRGEIAIVGEATVEALRQLEDDAPSFAGLFERLHVRETSEEETLAMMLHEARSLELRHGVSFSALTYRAVLDLARALFPGAAFPGKALDLARELAERARRERRAESELRHVFGEAGATPIEPGDVLKLLSEKTGLPDVLLDASKPFDPETARRVLSDNVIGQDDAIAVALDLVLRIRASVADPRRPFGVYLLAGPTGTGKTELAKTIAAYLYGGVARLQRFDMAEHSGPDAAARLVGDAWEPEGRLVRAVRQQPFSVLLFDEIEKAHPCVFPLLLQLFDEGRLTDASGQTADFRRTVILMTSNLGSRSGPPPGFDADASAAASGVTRAVEDFFAPELLNRIDRVVKFAPLSPVAARRIAAKELGRLLGRWGLAERNVMVRSGEGPLSRIVAEGFDPVLGARTVKRYLEDHAASVLAESLAASPPSRLSVLHLLNAPGAGQARFALHVETLEEVDPGRREGRRFAAPVRDLTAAQMRKHLAAAMDRLDGILAGPIVARVQAEISELVARRNRGEVLTEDAYDRDACVAAVRALRGRLGRELATGVPDRDRVVEGLALVELFERALADAGDPGAHAILMKLSSVGLPRHVAGGSIAATATGPGLLAALALAAAGESRSPFHARGELESFASVERGGSIRGGDRDALARAVVDRPVAMVMRIVGVAVHDYFREETGCHVWRSPVHGTEVARVEVSAAPGAETARDALAADRDALRRFEEALDRGNPLPPNPEGLLPLVREIRFTPPPGGQAAAPMEIEDHTLGTIEAQNVRAIADALPRLWTIRASRVTEPRR